MSFYSSSFLWTLSCNFFQILRFQKDVLSAAAVQAALPATSSSVPSQVPWALPTSKVPAEMPSCATFPTMPAEVPTQKQVEASAFIWIRKGWGQLTHLAPQLYLCLLFKSHHGYRRSFSTLQPAICLWRFQTARGFLSEVAIRLCSWKCPRKHHKASEGRTAALLLGPIRGFSHCLLCLSSGQGFLQAGKLLLILYLLNKVEFLCVMLKMLSLF